MLSDLASLCTLGALPALPQDWWRAWSLSPWVLLPLAALLAACLRRDPGDGPRDRAWRLAGVGLLALALVSPLCRLAATLVAGHMAQLMVLAVAAPALLARGGLARTLRGLTSRRTAGAPAGRGAGGLHAAALAYGLALWLRHVPAIYDAMLAAPAAQWAGTAAMAAVSCAFWTAVAGSCGARRGAAMLALLGTMAHTGLLGALLTFAPAAFYPLQAGGAAAWGLLPLQDQQLAGLAMWVPGNLAYLAAALALGLGWLRDGAADATRAGGLGRPA
ncbi:MAG: cytochrome c oxidase assembly protein [Xylophilus ampelinus]